jgi:uncharacterized membrane protein YecN with MAPEG domain
MTVTSTYAAVLALFYIGLSFWVIRLRRVHGVGLGHGGHPPLERAIRIHGNFAEYVPFCILIMLLLESSQVEAQWIHALGVTLVSARILHLWGIAKSSRASLGRFLGTSLTFLVLFCGALGILLHKA